MLFLQRRWSTVSAVQLSYSIVDPLRTRTCTLRLRRIFLKVTKP